MHACYTYIIHTCTVSCFIYLFLLRTFHMRVFDSSHLVVYHYLYYRRTFMASGWWAYYYYCDHTHYLGYPLLNLSDGDTPYKRPACLPNWYASAAIVTRVCILFKSFLLRGVTMLSIHLVQRKETNKTTVSSNHVLIHTHTYMVLTYLFSPFACLPLRHYPAPRRERNSIHKYPLSIRRKLQTPTWKDRWMNGRPRPARCLQGSRKKRAH